MDIVEAHGWFAGRPAESAELLGALGADFEPVDGLDPVPALCTAAVSLAGWLDDGKGWGDLCDGVRHFGSLLSAEVVTVEDWEREAEGVIVAVFKWG